MKIWSEVTDGAHPHRVVFGFDRLDDDEAVITYAARPSATSFKFSPEVIEWLDDTLEGGFKKHGEGAVKFKSRNRFYKDKVCYNHVLSACFASQEDAALFKLTWC